MSSAGVALHRGKPGTIAPVGRITLGALVTGFIAAAIVERDHAE